MMSCKKAFSRHVMSGSNYAGMQAGMVIGAVSQRSFRMEACRSLLCSLPFSYIYYSEIACDMLREIRILVNSAAYLLKPLMKRHHL